MQVITRESEYNDLKKTGKLVIVQFSAEWCGPCKAVKPKIENLANLYKDLTFLYVDIDRFEDLPDGRDVRGVPTFKFFKDGKLVDSFSGANADKVETTIKKHI